MNIKILTPEYVVFEGEVNSVLLPGKNGEFHIMKNHAGIVSSLIGGKVKFIQILLMKLMLKTLPKKMIKILFFLILSKAVL
jgi:F-type H+-transporting ATPase subunit epsilon